MCLPAQLLHHLTSTAMSNLMLSSKSVMILQLVTGIFLLQKYSLNIGTSKKIINPNLLVGGLSRFIAWLRDTQQEREPHVPVWKVISYIILSVKMCPYVCICTHRDTHTSDRADNGISSLKRKIDCV